MVFLGYKFLAYLRYVLSALIHFLAKIKDGIAKIHHSPLDINVHVAMLNHNYLDLQKKGAYEVQHHGASFAHRKYHLLISQRQSALTRFQQNNKSTWQCRYIRILQKALL